MHALAPCRQITTLPGPPHADLEGNFTVDHSENVIIGNSTSLNYNAPITVVVSPPAQPNLSCLPGPPSIASSAGEEKSCSLPHKRYPPSFRLPGDTQSEGISVTTTCACNEFTPTLKGFGLLLHTLRDVTLSSLARGALACNKAGSPCRLPTKPYLSC